MNFENCKKVITQYLEAKEAMKKLMKKQCENCKEKVCHCDECPIFINGQCRWDIN